MKMWQINDPQIRKSNFDFSSSGGGVHEVSQLFEDDIMIANAIEFIEFDETSVQLIICNACGTIGCESGNRVCFRRSSEFVLLIPDFENIEADDFRATQFAPPNYYDRKDRNRKLGTPYFDLGTYKNLRKLIPKLPLFEEIQSLKICEALRIAQLNMPFQVFGKPPEIVCDSNKMKLAVGASEGDANEHLKRIQDIFRKNYKNSSPALIRKILPTEDIIRLFLDADEFIDWQALLRDDGNFLLVLDENFAIAGMS